MSPSLSVVGAIVIFRVLSELPALERIGALAPPLFPQGLLLMRQQAGVQVVNDLLLVHPHPDEDQLLSSVPVRLFPQLHDLVTFSRVVGPVVPRNGSHPDVARFDACRTTGLRPEPRHFHPGRKPVEPLRADDVLQPAVQHFVEPLGMKRPTCPVDKAADAVLLGFRHMLAANLLQPARSGAGLLEVEQASVQNEPERDLAGLEEWCKSSRPRRSGSRRWGCPGWTGRACEEERSLLPRARRGWFHSFQRGNKIPALPACPRL